MKEVVVGLDAHFQEEGIYIVLLVAFTINPYILTLNCWQDLDYGFTDLKCY